MALIRPRQASGPTPRAETIEELFAALESPLLGYALRLTGERGSAEDIVQEAFMRLHAEFGEVRKPRSWLYRTVHNLAFNQRRISGRLVSLDLSADADTPSPTEVTDTQPLPDEQIARWEGIGLVRLSLLTLDARSQELLRLKFNDNLSYKEISARTGLTTGNVGYILHHAVKAVADELARNGIAP